MWERLRRFSALERPAQTLFLRALVLLPLVALSLRWRGFQSTQAALQGFLTESKEMPDAALLIKRVPTTAHMVNTADRHGLVHPSCLAKSMALWYLLGRQGIDSHLRIGTRKVKDKFEAHAWVERNGAALNEPDEHHHHYAAFDESLSALPPEES